MNTRSGNCLPHVLYAVTPLVIVNFVRRPSRQHKKQAMPGRPMHKDRCRMANNGSCKRIVLRFEYGDASDHLVSMGKLMWTIS